ncbi:MAG: hypothetical protein LRY62_03730 [Alphaproteobacteria bacterium]|nr:hypothetical protein [Alphaproteobacteria bacterium]
MLILNEASNQVMREFNVAMDDLISNADDLNKNADNWFKAKEKVIEEFQDRLAVIDEKRNAFPKALIELRKNPTDEKIEAVIEDRKDYKKDLLEAKKRLDEELQNSKEYLEFYRGRKNEMLDGFERRIHRLKDWRLEREYRHLIEEFRKDEINPERVKEIKARIDQRLTEIPANSRDHEMVARMREFGEQIRPIGQRIRRIESCFRQNAAIIEDLLKEVDEHINELEAMKGLSLEEKQARIDALLEKVEDSLKNSHNLKNLRNELEAQRLQIVVDRANERQITSMSRLTDWFAQNVQGGKKVTLLNGEEAEVFQARSTKLYYTIENGKRVYVSGEDQLKLLGQDNISIEDMRADRKRREQEAAAAEAEEADKKAGLEIYKPHEDTQRPGSEFNAAVDNGDKTGPATAPVLEERATISGP